MPAHCNLLFSMYHDLGNPFYLYVSFIIFVGNKERCCFLRSDIVVVMFISLLLPDVYAKLFLSRVSPLSTLSRQSIF